MKKKNILAAALPVLLTIVLALVWWAGGEPSQPLPAEPTQSQAGAAGERIPEEGAPDKAAPGEESTAEDALTARAREIAANYTLTEKEFQRHIMERHGPDSTDPAKSKFSADYDVRQGIDDALTGSDSVVHANTNGRDGYLFELTYDEPIGTDDDGRAVHTIRVVMGEDGFVVTAFPVK